MEVERLDDAARFLADAEPLLLADEARHNLVLGIAGSLCDHPVPYEEHDLWIVWDAGRAAAAALRTPPFNLVLARPESGAALDALARALAAEKLPGVTAALPEANEFAARWARTHPVAPRTTMRQHIYRLEQVERPPRRAGAPRDATAADRDLLVSLVAAFAAEAIHEGGPGAEHAARIVDHKLTASAAGFLLWEDGGEVVSLAGWGGPTPSGVRIGPVYTPPALRGRGYATSLTADLSQRLLAGGRRFCFLYTDADNPTSNAIYERIGYRCVCDSAEIAFDADSREDFRTPRLTSSERKAERWRQPTGEAGNQKSFCSFIAAPMSPLILILPVM